MGELENVGSRVSRKSGDLEHLVVGKIPGANVVSRMIGARELWQILSTEPEYDLQLRVHNYVPLGKAYSGLVRLSDYFDFLADESGDLRGNLFDWNVRDYQGGVMVNKGIQSTLRGDDSGEDFWWFNNGVTILCSEVSIGGDSTFTLGSVQIVNGMQTSHEIFTALKDPVSRSARAGARSVAVRIIQTQDEDVRDRIIRATNSQTKVPDASLHATEPIHRQIESHFKAHSWYYDRRKNFYKNTGKPSDRIIGIPALGQAVMAIGLSRPNDARARPTTLLNNDADYSKVFNEDVDLQVYLWLAAVQKRVESLLLANADPSVRTNFRFHISCYLVAELYGSKVHNPKQLSALARDPFNMVADAVSEATEAILEISAKMAADLSWGIDRVAKSKQFAEEIIAHAVRVK